MPGDTTYINNKAGTQNTYDAIVIGSGISGGWAAKELTEKGLKVLMLERGRNFEHIKDYKTANKDPWEFTHRGRATLKQKTITLSFQETGQCMEQRPRKRSWIIG